MIGMLDFKARMAFVIAAVDAATARAERDYVMVAFRQPFRGGRFNHIIGKRGRLALCHAVARAGDPAEPEQPLKLGQVDCLACLDAFAREMAA